MSLGVGNLPLVVRQNTGDSIANGPIPGDHDIRVDDGGTNIAIGHGSDSGGILLDDGLWSAAPLAHVALLATSQADFVIHVHENLGAQQLAQTGPLQSK